MKASALKAAALKAAALWLALAVAAPCAAAPDLFNVPLTGAGGAPAAGGGGGGGPAAYDPGGVLFWPEAGAQYVGVANLNGGVDTRHGVVAFRRRGSLGIPPGQTPADNWRNSGVFGNIGTGSAGAGCSLESCAGFMTNQDGAGWTGTNGQTLKTTMAGLNDGAGGLQANPSTISTVTNAYDDYAWQSVVIVYDTNSAQGSRKVAIWVNGTLISSSGADLGAAFDVNWNTARGVAFNAVNHNSGIPTGGAFEIADVYVDTANALPAGCPGTTANCQAIVDAYYKSGRPIDIGSAITNCNTLLASYSGSTQPDYCFRHTAQGATPNDFLTNRGTANAPTLVNTTSGSPIAAGNGAVLYNSPFGQGAEPTDRPYIVWSARSDNTVSTSTNTQCTGQSCTASVYGNFGGTILTGDRMFIAQGLCFLSTAPSATLPTAPTGWTFVTSTTSANPVNDPTSARCTWAIYTRVAPGNIIPSPNTPWQVGNAVEDPPTLNYTSTGVAPRNAYFLMFNTRSSTGAVNIDISDCQAISRSAAANADFTTPAVTTTAAKTTLLTLMGFRTGNNPVIPKAGNASQMQHSGQYSVGSLPFWWLGYENLTSAGAQSGRTLTEASGVGTTGDRAMACAIALTNG